MNHLCGYWHATPLHYVPFVLQTGALLSKARLVQAGLPIRPRPTAVRRDTKLGLAPFIHLSLAPRTPLLADKCGRGFLHVLLEFDPVVADLPSAAYLAYNAKAWRHRDDFIPITAPEDKAVFVAAWRGGRYPSAELLVRGALPLEGNARGLHAATEAEARWVNEMIVLAGLSAVPPVCVSPQHFPAPAVAPNLEPHRAYRDACALAGTLLSPPDLPFD